MDEQSMVKRVLDGDAEAFRAIVVEHNARVTAYVAGALGNRVEVDEVVQETFLAAYRGLRKFDGKSSLAVWLIGIARNKVLMHLRSKQRRRSATARLAERMLALTDEAAAHLRRESTLDRVDQLRHCMEKLPLEHQDLVRRCYLERVSVNKAAEVAGRSVDAVRSTLFRARRQLRLCMEAGA